MLFSFFSLFELTIETFRIVCARGAEHVSFMMIVAQIVCMRELGIYVSWMQAGTIAAQMRSVSRFKRFAAIKQKELISCHCRLSGRN